MQEALLELGKAEEDSLIVKQLSEGKYYRLGYTEAGCLLEYMVEMGCSERVIWHSPEEEKEGKIRISEAGSLEPAAKERLLKEFSDCGIAAEKEEKKRKNFEFISISRIRLLSFDAAKFIGKIPLVLCGIYSGPGQLVILIISIFIIIWARNFGSEIMENFRNINISAAGGFIFAGLILASLFLHELAHAMSCRHYGGSIRWMGIMLYFFMPCPYCDVSDMYMTGKRRNRLFISLAGVSANALAGDLALAAFCMLAAGGKNVPVLIYFWVGNALTIIFNLIPFVKLDGYWVISAMTGITNLMDKSIDSVRQLFRRSGSRKTDSVRHLLRRPGFRETDNARRLLRRSETKETDNARRLLRQSKFRKTDSVKQLSGKPGLEEKYHKRIFITAYGIAAVIFRPLFWAVSIYSIYEFLRNLTDSRMIYVIPVLLSAAAAADEIMYMLRLAGKRKK